MTKDPTRDAEIIRRYRDCGESQRGIARALGTNRNTVDRCLIRHEITKRPRPPVWTAEDRWRLVIICNSLNNKGQPVTGKEFKKFFPNHTYSSIKHHRDVVRTKGLIR
jgi:hypothetical protein